MSPEMRNVLVGKRLLLTKEMLVETGYCDTAIIEDIAAGFSLVGMPQPSGAFAPRTKLPQMTPKQLMEICRANRTQTLADMRLSVAVRKDDQATTELWEATLAEVGKRWLTGPYSPSEITEILGPIWTLSRRFGLVQGEGEKAKLRPIDDYTFGDVNKAYGTAEKLDLGGVDEVAGLVKLIMGAVATDGSISITSADGSKLVGKLHHTMDIKASRSIVGRTMDMLAAYRQLALAKSAAWTSVICVPRPGSVEPALFIQHALPFGAGASVLALNRYAKAVAYLGTKLFSFLWTQYFDDFPSIAFESGSADVLNL